MKAIRNDQRTHSNAIQAIESGHFNAEKAPKHRPTNRTLSINRLSQGGIFQMAFVFRLIVSVEAMLGRESSMDSDEYGDGMDVISVTQNESVLDYSVCCV